MSVTECEKLAVCAFHERYVEVAPGTVRRLIGLYCKGPLYEECKRKQYIVSTGNDPPITLMPNGRDAETGEMVEF